jgi:hypothetical protein
VSYLGVESGDPVGHKRFLALFSGGMLPIISLSFLHMLVKFEEDDKKQIPSEINVEELSTVIGKQEAEFEKDRYNPTPEELQLLEEQLIKLNEQKFDSLEVSNVPESPADSEVGDGIKRLSYLRRDA